MIGPIAAVLAAMIGTASLISGPALTDLTEDIKRTTEERLQQEEASRYLIAIDAGHQEKGNFEQEPIGPGASETKYKVAGGTTGTTTGVPEYELTLDVSLELQEELERRGYKVLMIRETHDVDIPNSERAQIANEAQADAFVRVHANGSSNPAANGAMTICQTSSNSYNSENYEDCRRLSELILDAYTEATGIRKEYVKETDSMSGINWCTVPVTIIELGYMTNSEEDLLMQDDAFQEQMAVGISDGIEAFLNEKEEKEAASTEQAGADSTGEAADSEEEADQASTEIAPETEPEEETESSEEEEVKEEEAKEEEAEEEDPEEEAKRLEQERLQEEKRAKEEQARALRTALASNIFAPARITERSAKEAGQIIEDVKESAIKRKKIELYVRSSLQMTELENALNEEIGKLGGKWSLYLKRMDTGHVIGINEDKKMVAASLIKLFVIGEFYTQGERGELVIGDYVNMPRLMLTVSDNAAANSLISACSMDKINEFAKENGYNETELNRRMLVDNGTENYTSARDCGRMLEKVLKGKYVNEKASESILEFLKASERRSKIPAGVPEGIETGNKTGELSYVDNDAAIIWSPECTYVLVIMSSDTEGRIPEIQKLSKMVYESINPEQD